MNKFTRGSAAVLAGLMLWMASGTSFGMGLGRPVSRAILGDTLMVSVPVRLGPGEDLSPECIKADVYFGDDKLPSAAIQTQLKTSPAPVGRTPEAVIQIRTTTLINEPVVTVYVVAGCQTRLTRKLVTLVDPPDLNEPMVSSSHGHSVTKGDTDDRVAATPLPALDGVHVVHDPISHSSKLGGRVLSLSLSGRASAKQRLPKNRSKDPVKASGARAVAERARLVVDPVASDAVVNPELQMTSGMTVPAQDDAASSPELIQRRRSAAAIWHAMNASPEALARDRERLEQVESKLDALSRDSAKASEVVTGLQSRLAQQANGDGLVYVLGTLIVVLVGFIGWREWAMRRTLSEQAAWLTSQVPDDTAPPASELGDTASLLPEIQDVVNEVDAELEAQAMPVAAPYPDLATVPRFDVLAQFAEQPPAKTAPVQVARQDHLRDVSVDELIDLEQQAEFFLVLGQDESAIDVLEGYICGTTSASPMPFLKLLEIYRRLGMRTDYERTRMNFNLRFNAHAPLWDADLTHGHELKDYPGVIERLQALWADPDRALEVLERSLMRQDAESYTFDLPAYRELLFLYAVLRDLSERPAPGHAAVDLLVSSHPSRHADMAPLMATLPMKALPGLAPTLSLDLELDDLFADPPTSTPPADHKP